MSGKLGADAYLVYKVEEPLAVDGVMPVAAKSTAIAFVIAPDETMVLDLHKEVPGVFVKLAHDCPTEDVVRVGMIALVGLLGQLVGLASMAGAPAPKVDPRILRARGQ